MNFCKLCMNLLEFKNKSYNCNNCNNTIDISNNYVLFHKKIKSNIIEENINNLKKYDIYRSKKDSNNNEFLLYNNINFESKKIYKK